MKRCPNCSRVLKKKSWHKPTPADLRKAEHFDAFEKEWCDDCMRRGESHNAILQVRGIPLEQVEPLVNSFLEANAQKGIVENGYKKKDNFYFSSKATARKISVELRRQGASVKETSKLVTYDRMGSRPLMRLTIVARFKLFPGDIIETRAGPDIVEKTASEWAWTRGGKKVRIKDAERIDAESRPALVIADNPPMVTLTETGETIEVESMGGSEIGQEVQLKSIESKNFIFKNPEDSA
ncbi:MAG: hypothetical protein GOV00_02820 [Candidatus Altiarchaeota archaeon]|nr:hypothetical protein [Candidatus Altiarchaeota archaeon]